MKFARATSQICLTPDLQKRNLKLLFKNQTHMSSLCDHQCMFCTNLYLCNLGELAARKVNEGQITETQRYGRVALDKWSSVGICGQLLMNNGIMTKEASMRTESDTTQITPSTENRTLLTLFYVLTCLYVNDYCGLT